MAKKHLSRNPQQITDAIWYYEEGAGIQVTIHKPTVHQDANYIQFVIPWRTLRPSLKRKDKSAREDVKE